MCFVLLLINIIQIKYSFFVCNIRVTCTFVYFITMLHNFVCRFNPNHVTNFYW